MKSTCLAMTFIAISAVAEPLSAHPIPAQPIILAAQQAAEAADAEHGFDGTIPFAIAGRHYVFSCLDHSDWIIASMGASTPPLPRDRDLSRLCAKANDSAEEAGDKRI